MSFVIALSGKGGSGKTTLAAMIVRHLVERGKRSVLAVDADPNACLGLALGATPEKTIAQIRDETLARNLDAPSGVSKERAFEYAIQQAVTERKGFDLLTMGHPEGPKCYCAVNNMLRGYLDAAGESYAYVVIDNEAGMEHLSRRTTDAVDDLFIVTEPTAVGAVTAERILGLSERLPIAVRHRHVLWNKVTGDRALPPVAADLPIVGQVPFDAAVVDLTNRGGTVFELPADDPAFAMIGEILTERTGALKPLAA